MYVQREGSGHQGVAVDLQFAMVTSYTEHF